MAPPNLREERRWVKVRVRVREGEGQGWPPRACARRGVRPLELCGEAALWRVRVRVGVRVREG